MKDLTYLELINREPLPDEVKEVKTESGEVVYKFIPKTVLQRKLIDMYFGHDQWEMLRDTVTKNGIWGVGVLKVKHPISGEWISKTGTAYLYHEKNMRLNYPALESQCFKNACKKLGVWFGQTLNSESEDAEPILFSSQQPIDEEHGISNEVSGVMEALSAFEYKEDAELYLNNTAFKHYIPAKALINSKPNKK